MSGAARYVVGVDFGTLSGRAVVVRVRRRRGAGQRGARLPARGLDRTLPATGRAAAAGLGAAGPVGLASRCCDRRPGGRRRRPASTRPRSSAIGTDFTACTVLPDARRRHAAVRARPSSRDRPHAYAKLWKHHAAQPQADRINALAHARGESWLARYGGRSPASGSSPRRCSCWRRTRRSTRATDRWVEAADWIVWQLCRQLRPQRLHRRLQGHPPGRRLPARATSWPR